MKPFRMALPRTLEGAVEACGQSFDKARLLAGGTDLLAEMKERIRTPETVVNLKTVPGLKEIRATDEGWEIGSLATLTQVLETTRITEQYPALGQTLNKTATIQLRNVGTVGGNLCQRPRCHYYRHEDYPCARKGGPTCFAQLGGNEFHAIYDNRICAIVHPSNLAPVLIAYDAQLEVAGPHGSLIRMPVEEFFVGPSENPNVENVLKPNQVVTRVLLPRGTENRNSAYVEARERSTYDWALCGATASVRKDGDKIGAARVVLSAVAPTPQRRKDLEQLLVGQKPDAATLQKVRKAAISNATPLSDNAYKTRMVQTVLERAILQAWKG